MDEIRPDTSEFWVGLVCGFLLHFCSLLFLLFGKFALAMLLGIGVTQLIYVGPLMIYFYRQGSMNAFKGMLLAAGITFLLNATCWGLVSSMR
jgi:hypothetical protein